MGPVKGPAWWALPDRAGEDEVGPDRLFYQSVLDGVMGQLGVGFHPHFVEKPCAVGADRFDAEAECFGDW